MSAALWVGGWPIGDDGGVLVSGLGPPPDVVGPILPLVPTIGELFDTGALLTAVVTSNGAVTTVTFEYGTTTAYGTSIAADQSPLSGAAIAELVSALVGGLTADTTYHWRVSATNSAGTTVSSDQSFTTLPAGTMFFDPLLASLVPTTAGNPTPTFTRATTAYVYALPPSGNSPSDQLLILCNAGEARFAGARRISSGNWSKVYSNNKLIPPDNMLGYVSENSATNNCLRSQEFDNATWVKTNATIGADAQTAPDGTLTADTLTDTATTTTHGVSQTIGTGSTYITVYAKAGTLNWLQLASNVFSSRANFNLATGVLGSVNNGTESSITLLGNGWYRCVTKFDSSGTNISMYLMNADIAGTPTYAGTGSGTIHLWGGQFTGGFGVSSYIPTTTVAVTRNRDVLSYVLATNMGTTIGTAYGEVTAAAMASSFQMWIRTTSPSANPLAFNNVAAPKPLNATPGPSTANTGRINLLNKGAFGYSTPNGSLCLNGGTVATSAAFTNYTSSTGFWIGTGEAEYSIQGSIRNIRIYNARITDANLIPLTAIAPTVTTVAASGITATGATLNGTVTSNGLPTTVDFQYGKTTNYNKTVTATQSPLAANAVASAVSVALTGLTTGTLYHYRVVGTNSSGATYGIDRTFTPA